MRGRVVIVEDELILQEFMTVYFEGMGFTVT